MYMYVCKCINVISEKETNHACCRLRLFNCFSIVCCIVFTSILTASAFEFEFDFIPTIIVVESVNVNFPSVRFTRPGGVEGRGYEQGEGRER